MPIPGRKSFSQISDGWSLNLLPAYLPSIELDQPTFQSAPEDISEETLESTEARITNYLIRAIQIGGIATLLLSLFYFASLWIESGWLYLQSAPLSLTYVYRKMEKQGSLLAGVESGETPIEFATRLTAIINSLSSKRSQLLEYRRSDDLIGLITNLYIQSAYSTHLINRNQSGEVISAWRRLRISLLLAKILQLTDKRKKQTTLKR